MKTASLQIGFRRLLNEDALAAAVTEARRLGVRNFSITEMADRHYRRKAEEELTKERKQT